MEKRNLKEFFKIVKSCHSTIKITMEYSLDKVNFLDIKVIRCANKLLRKFTRKDLLNQGSKLRGGGGRGWGQTCL